jgi:hypothetical protein
MDESEKINNIFEKYSELVDLGEETEDLTDQVLKGLTVLEAELTRRDIDLNVSRRKNKCTCKKDMKNCLCIDDNYSEVKVEDIVWGSNCTFCFRIEIIDTKFKLKRNIGWTLFSLHKKTDEEQSLIDCLYEKPRKGDDSAYNRWVNLNEQSIKIPVITYSTRDQRIDVCLKYMEWQRI